MRTQATSTSRPSATSAPASPRIGTRRLRRTGGGACVGHGAGSVVPPPQVHSRSPRGRGFSAVSYHMSHPRLRQGHRRPRARISPNFGDAHRSPDPDNADVWDRLSPTNIRIPRSRSSSFTATTARAHPRDRAVVAELLRVARSGGRLRRARGQRFVATVARVQPPPARTGAPGARRARASPSRAGWDALVGERRALTARPGDRVLLDHLSTALGEPGLVFAGTDRPCRDFVDAGAPAVHTRRTLRRLRQARVGRRHPAHDRRGGRCAPAGARRVPGRRARARGPVARHVAGPHRDGDRADAHRHPPTPPARRVPVEPLAEIAAVDGGVVATPIAASDYLRDADRDRVPGRDARASRRAPAGRAHGVRVRPGEPAPSAAGTATGSRGTSDAHAVAVRVGLGVQRTGSAARIRRAALRRPSRRGARRREPQRGRDPRGRGEHAGAPGARARRRAGPGRRRAPPARARAPRHAGLAAAPGRARDVEEGIARERARRRSPRRRAPSTSAPSRAVAR